MKFYFSKILLLFLFLPICTLGQQVSFTAPDTVCVDEVFNITNTSSDVDEVFWNFCGSDFSNPIEKETIDNLASLSTPVFIDVEKDGNDYFMFITNVNGKLTRLDFGNSLLNEPTEVNFGNINNALGPQTEGIQIVFDGQDWWGFIIGGAASSAGEKFIRLYFGNSLNNTPTTTNFGNIGDLMFPHDLHIFQEDGNWFGWTINRYSNSLTRFEFGNNLGNTPSAQNLGNIGELDMPSGFVSFKQNGNWFLFVANEGSNSITRLEFAEKLSNTPIGFNLGNLGVFEKPRDILIQEACGQFIGLVAEADREHLILLTFGDNLMTNFPLPIPIISLGEFEFPHAFSEIINFENDNYFFVINAGNNTVDRVKLKGCDNASIPNSNTYDPLPLSYDTEGTYIIQLTNNNDLANSFCKEIVVQPYPDLDIGMDTSICFGETFLLESSYSNTLWQNTTMNNSFLVEATGIYVAETSFGNCTSMDTISINFVDCDDCILFPNVFTPDNNQVNDIFQPVIQCNNNPQNYSLKIFNRWGENVFSSNDISRGWDGKHKNNIAPTDVYVWIVSYEYFNGEKIVSKKEHGEITLIH